MRFAFALVLLGCGARYHAPPEATDASVPSTAIGAPCGSPGKLGCAGNAQKLQVLCDGTKWIANGVCSGSDFCDTRDGPTLGSCQPAFPGCTTPGSASCDNATLVTCGPDLVSGTRSTCRSARHCLASTGGVCAPCFDLETRCQGAVLQVCKDRSTFVDFETCASEALCLDGEPKCFPPRCAVGEHRCTGSRLERCRTDRGDFELVKVCPPDSCDAARATCTVTPACSPGEVRCSGDTLETCKADVSGFEYTASCGPGLCDAATKGCKPATKDCVPGTMGCVGNTTAKCDGSGTWTLGVMCGGTTPTCSSGVCVSSGSCSPGSYRCTGYEILERCAADGKGWEVYKKCLPAFCDATGGECDDCKAGEKGCAGKTPRTCDATGHWMYLPPCAIACTDGACTT